MDKFGKRGLDEDLVNMRRASIAMHNNHDSAKNTRQSGNKIYGVLPVALLVAFGVSGLAMLGAHRFYHRGVTNGLKFFGIFVFLIFSAGFTGAYFGDNVGKTFLAAAILFAIYGCIESLVWGLREMYRYATVK